MSARQQTVNHLSKQNTEKKPHQDTKDGALFIPTYQPARKSVSNPGHNQPVSYVQGQPDALEVSLSQEA
jgi:hypothetical protein